MAFDRPSSVAHTASRPWVERPRLQLLLADVLAARLTSVVAGAGFGKTALLDAWAAAADLPVARIAITPSHRDAESVMRAIVDSLSRAIAVPGLLGHLDAARGPSRDDAAAAFASVLAGALRDAPDALLLVDDAHEADDGTVAVLEAVVRNAPETLHVVLASRSDPPFALDRMRGRGQVLEIGASALAFTEEETVALHAAATDRDTASRIWRSTGGWPAATRMALEGIRRSGADAAAVLDGLRAPGGSLFEYLAAEVFRSEPPSVRELVRVTAVFERFTADLCVALGQTDAHTVLPSLARRGLLVSPARQPGWFTLPALVRQFVEAAHPLDEWERREALLRAAAWFEEQELWRDTADALVAASDDKRNAEFLHRNAAVMLRGGHLDAVIAVAASLPDELRDARIEQAFGQARMTRGDWEGALACFHRAADAGATGAALGWRMGLIHYLRGELDEAIAAFEGSEASEQATGDDAMLLAWHATCHWVRGRTDECRSLAHRSLEVAQAAGDAQAEAAAHTVLAMHATASGDRAATETHTRSALAAAERAGDLLQVVRIRTNRGGHLADEGRYREALDELDMALPLAELTGFANFKALGLANRGQAKQCLGLLEEAIADLEAAKNVWTSLGSKARAYAIGDLADVYRDRGDLSLARAAYEEVLRIAESSGDAQALGPALAGLARVLVGEDIRAALAMSERAIAESPGPREVVALLAAGWVSLAAGSSEAAADLARRAAAEARLRNDRPGLAESLELEAVADPARTTSALQDALGIWESIANPLAAARTKLAIARLDSGDESAPAATLAALGVRSTAADAAGLLWAIAPERAGRLVVQTLGGFLVRRGRRAVPVTEWQSKKARDVLKILIARRGRPVAREELIEMLWPDEPPEKLAHRLSVALATVRAVLDPGKRLAADRFVGGDKEALWINRDELEIDVERFLQAAAEAQRTGSARAMLEAESLYTGEFLEEDPYAEWAVPLREEARNLSITIEQSLADAAERDGRFDAAVRHRLRALERDAYDEDAHLGVVRMLSAAGRHGEARRRYRLYTEAMASIGVEPAAFPSAGRASGSSHPA